MFIHTDSDIQDLDLLAMLRIFLQNCNPAEKKTQGSVVCCAVHFRFRAQIRNPNRNKLKSRQNSFVCIILSVNCCTDVHI